jgi:hypothetical protein
MLQTSGADLARWEPEPAAAARTALLADPAFRRAWEGERSLDAALGGFRDEIAETVARSGAAERIRTRTLRLIPADPLAGIRWQRIAAAVLLAGLLGAAMDLVFVEPEAPASEIVVAIDPLDTGSGVEIQ